MTKNKILVIGLSFFTFLGCKQTNNPLEKPLDIEAQTLIINLSKSIFSKEIINSKEILDTLETLSDTIYTDTAQYIRTPKATIYENIAARTYFQVFEDPKGTITAITFFKNQTEINVAEYYENGQVMCKFSVNDDGKRNGNYFCYFEDGTYRITGHYINGTEIKDSLKTFEKE